VIAEAIATVALTVIVQAIAIAQGTATAMIDTA